MTETLNSYFVREGRPYQEDEIRDILSRITSGNGDLESAVTDAMTWLKAQKLLKELPAQNITDLDYSDIELDDDIDTAQDTKFVFKFVGIISLPGLVLKCYPKYMLSASKERDDDFKEVFRVLIKYNNSRMYNLRTMDADTYNSFNLLSLILYLLMDYYANGLYTNTELILEDNGSGEIIWDKTVNEHIALISNNRPLYSELITKKRVNADSDFFRRLHCCILTKCSDDLKAAGLLEIFELPETSLSDENLDDFGDKEYILYRLQRELNVVYDSRKQLLLGKMIDYVTHNSSLLRDDSFTFYGTYSFNLVWEAVCSKILGNQRDSPLSTVLPGLYVSDSFDSKMTLKEIIDKPVWKKEGSSSGCVSDKTLEPDILHLHLSENNNDNVHVHVAERSSGDQSEFLIFDAKYYNTVVEENEVRNQPGVGDVTKQYLYQLAFMEFINKLRICTVHNCFLMPTEEKKSGKITASGEVTMKFLSLDVFGKKLEPIKIFHVPVKRVYAEYLNGVTGDVLNSLVFDSPPSNYN